MEQQVRTCSEQETEALGAALAEKLFPGAVLLLEGELGAGKTVFARGVARGLGVRSHVQSPTFTIMNEYRGKLPFYHFDLYRLESEEELFELGMDEYLEGDGVSLVEWAGKFPGLFDGPALEITITQENGCRTISFRPGDSRYGESIRDATGK